MAEKPQIVDLSSSFSTAFFGPPLDEGLLPALFYFALSAEESLSLPPFNQPITYLLKQNMRLFSITLPGHGPGLNPHNAITHWAELVAKGENPIKQWAEEAKNILFSLLKSNVISKEQIALAGLSRGAFSALHLAAKIDFSLPIVGYAPLLDLTTTNEFATMQNHSVVQNSKIENFVDQLEHHRFLFTIGNRDVRVDTNKTFSLVTLLTEKMFKTKKRSPPVELHVTPSIGFKGHGTSPENFILGASWAAKQIGIIDETM